MKAIVFACALLPILTYAAPIGATSRQQLVKKSQLVGVPARAILHYARQADTSQQGPKDDAADPEETSVDPQSNVPATATATADGSGSMDGTATDVDAQATGLKGGKGENRQQEVDGSSTDTTRGNYADAPFEAVICRPCSPNTTCKGDCIPYTITVTPDAYAAAKTGGLAMTESRAEVDATGGARGGKAGGAMSGEGGGATTGTGGGATGSGEVEGGGNPTLTSPIETPASTATLMKGPVTSGAGGAGPASDY